MTPAYSGAALSAALFAFASPAQGPLVTAPPNVISVTGDAEVRVVPDEVVLSLGVETFDKVLRTAKQQNDDAVRKALAFAREQAILPDQIQTDYIGIEPRYRRSDVTDTLLGFVVRKTIVIRLKDITKFEELLTGTLEAGVTHVHGIEFRTTALRKYRDQARLAALKAANEKAALLANEVRRTIGPAISIGEASYGYHSSYGSGWGSRYGSMTQNSVQSFGGAAIESDATLAPGQIAIRVSVSATFPLN